ncbi:hypothetical protein QJS10_CPA08g00944 [Acorus calamus]|uniref:Uncharacterized protein n=1 Tax=Acorus calamus TaxID=4465 RepID=A0AAV9EFJ1_ACOCL|nr:hypothetical protein QJS10_CPA08g00944 [Acorus calamus]
MVDDTDDKGLLWRLPVAKTKNIGKIGPGFGYGAGCGVGFGLGLVGGAGIGAGFPGLQFGVGIGAGCGIGIGFGYGVGRGVAYDESRRYSNVGKLFQQAGNLSSQEHITVLMMIWLPTPKSLSKQLRRRLRSGDD